MIIYLISNNLLLSNICYDNEMDIEEKKLVRTLSVEGSGAANKINLFNVANIYSASYFSSIECAKYLASKNGLDIILSNNLNDCLIGDLKKQSIKMLSYFQEHDFNYKLLGGESINECAKRIETVIKEVKALNEDAAVFLPKRAMFSYLTKFTTHGFNLDERMVLTFNDEIIMDTTEDDIEIVKLDFSKDELEITKLDLEKINAL